MKCMYISFFFILQGKITLWYHVLPMIHFQPIETCCEHYVVSCHPTFDLYFAVNNTNLAAMQNKVKVYVCSSWSHAEEWKYRAVHCLWWACVITVLSCLLYSCGKKPLYPMSKGLGKLQSQSGCFGEERNLLSLPGIAAWFLAPLACILLPYQLLLQLLFVWQFIVGKYIAFVKRDPSV